MIYFQKSEFKIETTILVDFLKSNNFITQPTLEDLISNFVKEDRNRKIIIKNLFGKLKLNSKQNLPYWNLLLETNSLITKRKISNALASQLNLSTALRLKIVAFTTQESFKTATARLSQEDHFLLEDPNWTPGYFTTDTIHWINLSRKPGVKKYIQDSILA